MQIRSFLVTLVAGSLVLASCNLFKSSKVELKTLADSVAYAIGSDMAGTVVKQLPNAPGGSNLNQQIILSAFTEVINGKTSQIPADKVPVITQSYFLKMQAIDGAKNAETSKKFLDDNGKRSEVKTTASGLQYEVMKDGTGAKPEEGDTVKVLYKGTTLEGKVFDSQLDATKPASFLVNQVIPGWTEALKLMPSGAKWKLFIPSDLAYGERGAGADIKPNSALIFEVELLNVVKKK
jgi:FKBP-type peptidyl-prolyl cis-trans isomerase